MTAWKRWLSKPLVRTGPAASPTSVVASPRRREAEPQESRFVVPPFLQLITAKKKPEPLYVQLTDAGQESEVDHLTPEETTVPLRTVSHTPTPSDTISPEVAHAPERALMFPSPARNVAAKDAEAFVVLPIEGDVILPGTPAEADGFQAHLSD
jgi:hypothetical protein